MNYINPVDHKSHLSRSIQLALTWANESLRAKGAMKRLWICPNQLKYIAAEILSYCKASKTMEIPKASTSQAIKICACYVHTEEAHNLGGLTPSEKKVELGMDGADVELHIFFFDGSNAQRKISNYVANSDESWEITGKFIKGSSSGFSCAIATMARRIPEKASIRIDQSVLLAYDSMRIAAIQILSQYLLKYRSAIDLSSESKLGSSRDVGSIFDATTSSVEISEIQRSLGLRIGFYLSSFSNFGGLEQWVINMALAFLRIGINSTIICLHDQSEKDHIPRELKHNIIYLKGNSDRLAQLLAEDNFDALLVNHTYAGLEAVAGNLDIYEVIHNIYYWQRGDKHLENLRSKFAKIICISSAVKRYTTNYLNVVPASTHLIEHGIDKIGFVRPTEEYRIKATASSDFRVICVANLYPQKNILALIMAFEAAFESHPFAHLDLVGSPTHEGFASKIKGHLEHSKLKSRIILHGGLNRRELSRVYAHGSLFCLPSLYEGFGLATLEAMYFGIPLVLSDTGHSRELAEMSGGIVVDASLEPQELTDAKVLEMALDPPAADVERLRSMLWLAYTNYADLNSRAVRHAYDNKSRSVDNVAAEYAEMIYSAAMRKRQSLGATTPQA